jgi:hypothetical protein
VPHSKKEPRHDTSCQSEATSGNFAESIDAGRNDCCGAGYSSGSEDYESGEFHVRVLVAERQKLSDCGGLV